MSEDLEADRFVTAFIGFFSADGTVEWASAGHGPILWRCAAGEAVQELMPTDMPLGVMPDLMGEAAPAISLRDGGVLAIVSDGIFEARNPVGEQFGMPRVIEHLEEHCDCNPPAVIGSLRAATTAWQGQEEPLDDQTIVVARRS
jgi:sigma-B regulation protein RsbU (phosphoserine phosphatase)